MTDRERLKTWGVDVSPWYRIEHIGRCYRNRNGLIRFGKRGHLVWVSGKLKHGAWPDGALHYFFETDDKKGRWNVAYKNERCVYVIEEAG